MVKPIDASAVLTALQEFRANPIWAASIGWGANLTLDAGKKIVRRTREGKSSAFGELSLWLNMCEWHVAQGRNTLLRSASLNSSDKPNLLQALIGERLIDAAFDTPKKREVTFWTSNDYKIVIHDRRKLYLLSDSALTIFVREKSYSYLWNGTVRTEIDSSRTTQDLMIST